MIEKGADESKLGATGRGEVVRNREEGMGKK